MLTQYAGKSPQLNTEKVSRYISFIPEHLHSWHYVGNLKAVGNSHTEIPLGQQHCVYWDVKSPHQLRSLKTFQGRWWRGAHYEWELFTGWFSKWKNRPQFTDCGILLDRLSWVEVWIVILLLLGKPFQKVVTIALPRGIEDTLSNRVVLSVVLLKVYNEATGRHYPGAVNMQWHQALHFLFMQPRWSQ